MGFEAGARLQGSMAATIARGGTHSPWDLVGLLSLA